MSPFKEVLHKYDNHYQDYKNQLPPEKGLRIIHFLKNKHALPELVNIINKKTKNKHLKKGLKILKRILKKTDKDTYKDYKRSGRKLLDYAYGEEGLIFAEISKKFKDLAHSRSSKAFIFVSPQGFPMNFPEEYKESVAHLKKLCSRYDIELHDLGEEYFSLDEDLQKKYDVSKTHASPEGNRFIAGWLYKKFKETGLLMP